MHGNADPAGSEAFRRLVRLRRSMTWSLSGMLLLVFAGNLFLMSFGAGIASVRIAGMTVGVIYSAVLILIGIATAIGYAWWANSRLDPLIEEAAAA
ncbi:MAG: DUF485 domain-containing protein, partial [Pseudomonadota bacterium]